MLGQIFTVMMVAVVLLAIPAPVSNGQAFWNGSQPEVVDAHRTDAHPGDPSAADPSAADPGGADFDEPGDEDCSTTMVIDTSEEEEHLVSAHEDLAIVGPSKARFDSNSAPSASERTRLLKPPRA